MKLIMSFKQRNDRFSIASICTVKNKVQTKWVCMNYVELLEVVDSGWEINFT